MERFFPCPICGADKANRLFLANTHWILGCQVCGHRFAELLPSRDHIAVTYGDSYFFRGGAGYPNYLLEGDLLRKHGHSYGALLCQHVKTGHVLDVGSAAGFVLRGIVDTGWRGVGVEPNPRMAAYARERLGLEVQASTIEELHGTDRYDVVTMIQVLHHFVDPIKALTKAAELTKGDGWWLIETWNPKSLTAYLFGKHWHAYNPPSALHWFTPSTLGRLAARFDFHEVARGRPAKRIKSGHMKSLLSYHLRSSWTRLPLIALKLVPDRLDLRYPAEDLFWALYKRSSARHSVSGTAQTEANPAA